MDIMTTTHNNKKPIIFKCLIFISIVVFIEFLLYSTDRKIMSNQLPMMFGVNKNIVPNECSIPEWNRIRTESVPNSELFRKWVTQRIAQYNRIRGTESRLLSSFVYPDHIAVVTTAMNTYGKEVYCRYYDCNRNEIPGSMYKSFIMQLATAKCARREGAEYMSLSFTPTDIPPEPIPLIYRAYEKPVHELSVCVGPIYGKESKWLEIVEYVEHYRLIGATFFYFTFFNLNEYDRRIIDNYVRLGMAEVTTYQIEYRNPGWQFHLFQTNECHQRSMYHSKWVANVDIDERLVYTGPFNFVEYLRLQDPEVVEFSLSTTRVRKTDNLPEKYKNSSQLLSEMMFLKYNETTETTFYNLKGIIRPEKVAIPFYHWSNRQLPGGKLQSIPKRIANIRHYRSTDKNMLNGKWQKLFNKYKVTRLESEFEKKLIDAVEKRVKYVYEHRIMRCEEISPGMLNYPREILNCRYATDPPIPETD